MLTFFNNTADDLIHTITNLLDGKYSHLRGTHLKTSTSLQYVNQVILPVLTAMFDHLASCEYGNELLRKILFNLCLYLGENNFFLHSIFN